ncbi:MAG: sigma factor-like helix-turn-helix DNA-binding protein [Oscillospiraceae bacterium]
MAGLKKQERDIFVSRYWYMAPVDEIAEKVGFSYSKTASILHRTRLKLGLYLRKEGLM